MTALSKSFSLMIICDVFSLLLLTSLLFSQVGKPVLDTSFCNACAKVKPMHKPVPKEHTSPHATNVGNKVHSNVWGPATPQSHYRKEYFISFINDHSHWSHIEPMSRKSETLTQHKNHEAWLNTQCDAKI